MKNLLLTIPLFLGSLVLNAQEIDTLTLSIDSTQIWIDEIEANLNYQHGVIELESGNATISVPEGFGFLDKEQANYVLTDLWGNMEDETILGLLVPENRGVMDDHSWLFTVSFEEMGYVEDEDADDIDYDDLLEELQEDTRVSNEQRAELGYQTVELVGWAASPHYDANAKVLHWAKELRFEGDSINTLNYNLRVLGRKGVFVLNAVASMPELEEVESNIDNVLTSVSFKEGHRYADFLPEVDEVAAWTVGGLVAGKVLAKAGFFAIILKFWKIIAVAVASFGGAIWKKIKGNKEEKDTYTRPENKEIADNKDE